MSDEPITRNQLILLHALWRLYVVDDNARADRSLRLEWASNNVGRPITSFNDLTRAEARSLADVLRLGLEPMPELPEHLPAL